MKKTFISGLAVVVPFALTLWILIGVFGTVDAWINQYLEAWFNFSLTGLGVVLAVIVIYVTGAVTRTTLGQVFYNLVNRVVYKVPFINKVYKLAKETIDVVTTEKAFSTVVRVNFPTPESESIGFLTSPNTVFIPTTPNPTNGFLFQTDKYEILDISVEDALRFIISMGTINKVGNYGKKLHK